MQSYSYLLEKLTFYLGIFIAIVLLIETFFSFLIYKKTYKKELLVNFITGAVSIFTMGFIKTFVTTVLMFKVYEYRLYDSGIHWYTWAIGFLAYTFYDYFTHVLYHRVRFFWCFHAVHHSIQYMHSSAGFRVSVLDIFSLRIFLLLFPLFGIHPLVYFIIYTATKFWGVVIHVNEKYINKIGFLGYILVSPNTHHLHHGSNKMYIDKNYGEVVPWYDMMFGSYVTEIEKPRYGSVNAREELNFWDSQLYEFRRLYADLKKEKKYKNKLRILLYPPSV